MTTNRLLTSKWLMLVAAGAVLALGAGTSYAGGHYWHGSFGYTYCPPYVPPCPYPSYGYAPYCGPQVVIVPGPVYRPRVFIGHGGFVNRGFRGGHRR